MAFSAAWLPVECADCGKRFQCRPEQDYYHRPNVPDGERTVANGVCEPCLLTDAGIRPDQVVVR